MSHDSIDLSVAAKPKSSLGPKLLGVLLALLVTGALLAGYGYIRKRHAQQTLASATPPVQTDNTPKGPPKAQIIMDEPLLKGTDTIIGGTVKNLSNETLNGLVVRLELRRRKDGKPVETTIAIEPSTLRANEEGAYAAKFPAHEYGSVRLLGLNGDPNATQLAYVSAQGKQRPPERIEPKTIVITKSPGGEFLNSPDKPARVP
jgi:hypothetical protein